MTVRDAAIAVAAVLSKLRRIEVVDLMEIAEEVKRKVLTEKALEAARDLAQLLAALEEESESLCQVILVMHRLATGVPMPQDMYDMLVKFGHKPDVEIISEEEMMAIAETNDCDCARCQELRAKSRALKEKGNGVAPNAPGPREATKPDVAHLVTPGPNTVH